jgi:hypothetical protein
VRPNQRKDARKEFVLPFLRLVVEGGTEVRGGVLGGVVHRISSSVNTWGIVSWTLTRIFVAMGPRRTKALLSRTRLPGTCVRGVWRGAFEFNVVSTSSSSLSESTGMTCLRFFGEAPLSSSRLEGDVENRLLF